MKNQKEDFEYLVSKMITEEDILQSIPNLYNLSWWPKDDFDVIKGFTMKSSEEEFSEAVKKVGDYLGKQTKGNVFKIGSFKFKIRQTDLRKKEINIIVGDKLYDDGDVEMKWWITRRGGKLKTTLQVQSRQGAESCHIKTMLQAIKFLMDGTLENGFTKSMLDSFILKSGPQPKDECPECGYCYKTPVGEKLHKCDLIKMGCPECPTCDEILTSQENLKIHIKKVHPNQDSSAGFEPMQLSQDSQDNADQVLSLLLDKVIDSRAMITHTVSGKDTAPAPPKSDISVTKWRAKYLPGSVIKSVSGRGACLLEALSYILWQTTGHYKTIGKAINKYILENYEKLEASNEIFYPLTRICKKISDTELIFRNREEFQSFLKSEDSIYAWREGTDLEILSTLFEIQINVLVSKNGKLDGGRPIVIGETYTKTAVVLHNVEEGHYSAVVAPYNPNKNFTLLNNIKRYVDSLCEKKGDSVKVDPTKDLKKDELKEMMNRMDSLSRTLGVLQSRVDFFEKEKARNDAENVKLRGEIEALKANRCGHQSLRLVPANPDITVIKQPEVLPQPGQANSVKDMDTDVDHGRKNELDELNRLKALKGQGFVRVSPQARAFEKPQTPMFCLTCNVRFENKDALREHRVVCPKKAPSINENSPGPEANAVVGERIQTLNSQQKVAVLNRQARSYNCEECAFQATGGGRSKALLKHFREDATIVTNFLAHSMT